MAKKLLLLSNSTNHGEDYLQWSADHVRAFLGSGVRRVFFVPYAGVRITYSEYTEKVRERFGEWGYDVLAAHETEDPVAAAREAQAIAVGGGNSFELLKKLYDTGLLEMIRTRAMVGTPYIGWSAGSNMACPTIRTTNDMPIVEPESLEALDLVPFQINPHYTEAMPEGFAAETRMDRLMEFIELNPEVNVVGLPEGTLLHVDGEAIRYIGDKPAVLLRKGNQPRKLDPGSDWDFLL